MAESVARQHDGRLTEQQKQDLDICMERAAPPAITYGKRTRKIRLKGTHFRRPETRDILQDDEEPSLVLGKPYKTLKRQPEPDDSVSSEDDLNTIYNRSASSRMPSRSSSPLPLSSSRTSIDVESRPSKLVSDNIVRKKKGVAKIVTKRPIKPDWVCKSVQMAAVHKSPSSIVTTSKRKAQTISAQGEPLKPKAKPETKTATPAPARRLPVHELVMISAQAIDAASTPLSSAPGPQTQDPIEATSTPVKRRRVSSVNTCKISRAPLTSIRKRLKTPKFTHTSVIALRKKHKGSSSTPVTVNDARSPGDGFSSSEMAINHRPTVKKQYRTHKSLVFGFGTLHLQSGPLPEVKFECSNTPLKLEASNEIDGEQSGLNSTQHTMSTEDSSRMSTDNGKTRRKMSFRPVLLSNEVRAQLSSVSAPKRVHSILSNDSENEDFVSTDGEDDVEIVNTEPEVSDQAWDIEYDESGDESDELLSTSSPARTPASNQRTWQNSNFWRRNSVVSEKVPPRNGGVTLDFREPLAPDMLPSETLSLRRGRKKMSEAILGSEPVNHQQPQIAGRITRTILDPSESTTSGRSHTAGNKVMIRPRSILRRTTPTFQRSDTSSRHTATTTRLTKRRSSQLRPEHLNQKDKIIQVPDSDSMVLETSPQGLNHINHSQSNKMTRKSEAVWTSFESLPRVVHSRDLKKPTTDVSRGNRMSSEATSRRRPSLPFRSPMKVRVI